MQHFVRFHRQCRNRQWVRWDTKQSFDLPVVSGIFLPKLIAIGSLFFKL